MLAVKIINDKKKCVEAAGRMNIQVAGENLMNWQWIELVTRIINGIPTPKTI